MAANELAQKNICTVAKHDAQCDAPPLNVRPGQSLFFLHRDFV
jgi:hypothetical protein